MNVEDIYRQVLNTCIAQPTDDGRAAFFYGKYIGDSVTATTSEWLPLCANTWQNATQRLILHADGSDSQTVTLCRCFTDAAFAEHCEIFAELAKHEQ